MKEKFFTFLICVVCISRANGMILKPVIENDDEIFDEVFGDDTDAQRVNSNVAKAVTKFSCIADFEDAELLVYGTKAWRFPEQDINLTLTYPSDYYTENDDYVITGFRVMLFVDNVNIKGYINSGGLFEENLSLSFVSSKVNMLFYQFWLYGTPKANKAYVTQIVHDLC